MWGNVMEHFIRSVRNLGKLLEEEKERLVQWNRILEEGRRGRSCSDALSKVRKQIRNCCKLIVEEVSDPQLSHQLLNCMKKIYADDLQTLGFPRTYGILSIKQQFLTHFPDRPCCLLSPISFPARRLAKYIMQEIGTRALVEMDCVYGIGEEFLSNSPSARHRAGNIVAYNFDRLHWGSQRALCDVCSRHKIPLIAIIQTKTRRTEFNSVADYELDDIEAGVVSRLYFGALNYRDHRTFSENAIENHELESALRDENNWREGFFPLKEVLSMNHRTASGWGI